ncbi:hypothetical protein AVEN_128239-1 [Araneus ventricosus]|uniref:Uncharacterized protein n=1 Tax=Araneus ventricosus TaxID=182803 RepID=A0A4Y2A122_ARAVE|nr:hypothetical protein AVEN_128239-1 [Araneus ventricosus]
MSNTPVLFLPEGVELRLLSFHWTTGLPCDKRLNVYLPNGQFDRGMVPGFPNHKSYAGVTWKYTANLLTAEPYTLYIFDSYLFLCIVAVLGLQMLPSRMYF